MWVVSLLKSFGKCNINMDVISLYMVIEVMDVKDIVDGGEFLVKKG